MNSIIIRPETEQDYRKTEYMIMRAFWNRHFPGCNEYYLPHVIRTSPDYLPEYSRVAELNGEIVGAIFYMKARVKDRDKTHEIISFGPLAVEPTCQSMGIGRLLLETTISLVREAGYSGIVMNSIAICRLRATTLPR